MKLVTWAHPDGPRPAGLTGTDTVVDLSGVAQSVDALIEGGPEALDRARDAIRSGASEAAVALLAPLHPASLRDFLAFEDHAKAGAARRGEALNPAWYRSPVSYKGNHRSIVGPGADVAWPSWSERLDFELEVACVIGIRSRDLAGAAAERAIFGYTIMNDWSARDVQRDEMAMRLGPAKSKDFATSLGPCIVTADEIDPRDGLTMVARVNGEEWTRASTAAMHWTFPKMIAHVSAGEDVWPRDVYGSGTAFGGCGLDLDRWISPGDVVELEVEGIGVLRNRVVR
ncbi:MAG: fumarylacetoacetate hydrolase family protein [Actinobacteria bacterium]|nr:MAG: fumarylacetoacetate hydrolase family protein [Actinomycetota bacterium]